MKTKLKLLLVLGLCLFAGWTGEAKATANSTKSIEATKAQAINYIDNRIASLQKQKKLISDAKYITPDHKKTLVYEIDGALSELPKLRNKVKSHNAADQLRNDYSEIRHNYNVYSMVIPKTSVVNYADSLNPTFDWLDKFSGQMDHILAERKYSAVQKKTAQTLTTTLRSQIGEGRAEQKELTDSVLALRSEEYNNNPKILKRYYELLASEVPAKQYKAYQTGLVAYGALSSASQKNYIDAVTAAVGSFYGRYSEAARLNDKYAHFVGRRAVIDAFGSEGLISAYRVKEMGEPVLCTGYAVTPQVAYATLDQNRVGVTLGVTINSSVVKVHFDGRRIDSIQCPGALPLQNGPPRKVHRFQRGLLSPQELADKARMTTAAKNIFFANHPVVVDDEDLLLKLCSEYDESKGKQQIAIGGCFISTEKRIFILDARVRGEIFSDIAAQTAAHENLHAIYDRYTPDQKTLLNSVLAADRQKVKDPEVRSTFDWYVKNHLDKPTETYAVLGTESYEISPTLEKNYAKYFINRRKNLDDWYDLNLRPAYKSKYR